MEEYLYVMLMNNKEQLNEAVVQRHVAHLRTLYESGQLVLCGPFVDFQGGLVILKAGSYEEANLLAEADPFIAEGYKTYELRTLNWATSDNNFLLS